MSVNVGINPLDVYNIATGNERADQARGDQLYQSRVDNAFRNQQYQTQEAWNWRKWNDRKHVIQNLVADAQKAGISPLAALGGSGAAPANVSMPVGQGGRVAGTYQRQPRLEASVSAELQAKSSRLDLANKQNIHYFNLSKARIEDLKFKMLLDDWYKRGNPDPLYKNWSYNIDEAQQWHKEGFTVLPDPAAGLELPESVGGFYYGAPKAYIEPSTSPSFNAVP